MNRTGKQGNNVCGAGRHETAGRRFSGKAGKFERSGAGKVRKQRVQCEDRRKTAGIISLSVSANVLKS